VQRFVRRTIGLRGVTALLRVNHRVDQARKELLDFIRAGNFITGNDNFVRDLRSMIDILARDGIFIRGRTVVGPTTRPQGSLDDTVLVESAESIPNAEETQDSFTTSSNSSIPPPYSACPVIPSSSSAFTASASRMGGLARAATIKDIREAEEFLDEEFRGIANRETVNTVDGTSFEFEFPRSSRARMVKKPKAVPRNKDNAFVNVPLLETESEMTSASTRSNVQEGTGARSKLTSPIPPPMPSVVLMRNPNLVAPRSSTRVKSPARGQSFKGVSYSEVSETDNGIKRTENTGVMRHHSVREMANLLEDKLKFH